MPTRVRPAVADTIDDTRAQVLPSPLHDANLRLVALSVFVGPSAPPSPLPSLPVVLARCLLGLERRC